MGGGTDGSEISWSGFTFVYTFITQKNGVSSTLADTVVNLTVGGVIVKLWPQTAPLSPLDRSVVLRVATDSRHRKLFLEIFVLFTAAGF